MTTYGFSGWESETEGTEGDGREDVYFLTISLYETNSEGEAISELEEIATIIHRTVGGKYPLDGETANIKVQRAQQIVSALNLLEEVPNLLEAVEQVQERTGDYLAALDQIESTLSAALGYD